MCYHVLGHQEAAFYDIFLRRLANFNVKYQAQRSRNQGKPANARLASRRHPLDTGLPASSSHRYFAPYGHVSGTTEAPAILLASRLAFFTNIILRAQDYAIARPEVLGEAPRHVANMQIQQAVPPREGFWTTIPLSGSAVNFCEEDYAVTYYVAEFFNTLTSLAYIAYGIHGIRRFKRRGIHLFAEPNLSYWALIGVGIFSGLYHTTLKYYTQMSDELSMHLAIGTILHQVYTFNEPPNIQRRNTAIILGVIVPFVIYHCVTDEFLLHVILFFIMCWMVGFRTRKLIQNTIKDQLHRKKLRRLVGFATWTSMSAYGIWNIDVHFCPQVHRLKHQFGMPWAIALELHGYWHIMTAIGAYTFMAIIEFLLSPEHLDSHGVNYAWPAKAVLQDIIPEKAKPKVHANGYANGHVNGHVNGHANGYTSGFAKKEG